MKSNSYLKFNNWIFNNFQDLYFPELKLGRLNAKNPDFNTRLISSLELLEAVDAICPYDITEEEGLELMNSIKGYTTSYVIIKNPYQRLNIGKFLKNKGWEKSKIRKVTIFD